MQNGPLEVLNLRNVRINV